MDIDNYSYTNDRFDIDGDRKFKTINPNWTFKQRVKIAVKELWEEGEHLYDWGANVRYVAWEIIKILDDDPVMSFEEVYELVMDY